MSLPPGLQLFLQHCIGERYSKESELKQTLKYCYSQFPETKSTSSWVDTIAQLNSAILKFDLELRRGFDQETGETLWALVNTSDDDIALLATTYTSSELSYFKALIEAIITSNDNFFIKQTEALQLTFSSGAQEEEQETPTSSQLTAASFTKTEKEFLIESFVKDGWLAKSRQGYLTLGTRSILELQFKLKTQYEGYIFDCDLCKATFTQGSRCNRDDCEARFHEICLSRSKSSHKRCPTCLKAWSPVHIGPPAAGSSISQEHVNSSVSSDSPPVHRAKHEESSDEAPDPRPTRRLRKR